MNRFERWLVSRFPESDHVTLTQRRIYILPTKAGWFYVLVGFGVLLLGINYQNNLAYAVAFLMASVMITAILHTFNNLSGITLRFEAPSPCFANRPTHYRMSTQANADKYQVKASLAGGVTSTADLSSSGHMDLGFKVRRRGDRPMGVVTVETIYPLGLLRAWSRTSIPHAVLVYPEPIMGGLLTDLTEHAPRSDQNAPLEPEDDLDTLKEYQQGESLRRIAWRKAAKGQGLYSLQFEEKDQSVTWLSMALWPELDTETRLSRLTAWVLELEKQGTSYGWHQEGCILLPSVGESHKRQVLEQLARFGLAPKGRS